MSKPSSPGAILFGADFHLTCRPCYGSKERTADFVRAFQSFVDSVIDNDGVVAATLLGDTADEARPPNEVQKVIAAGVSRIIKAGKVVYYLSGNHDHERPTLPDYVHELALPGFIDAEQEFLHCVMEGRPFQPYGPTGPKVAVLHFASFDQIEQAVNQIRQAERPENQSTEIWLHQAIAPGVPKMMATQFDGVGFAARGWHTIFAGDIHSGGIYQYTSCNGTGTLIYPGSPEMTKFDEDDRKTRGFILHHPVDHEPVTNPDSLKKVVYNNRPYRTFTCPSATKTKEEIEAIVTWLREKTDQTGLKPIIRIVSPDLSWRREPALEGLAIFVKFEPFVAPPRVLVPTAPAELLPNGELGGGNAERYGSVYADRSIYGKLAYVLNQAPEIDKVTKDLGHTVLLHPNNPELWEQHSQRIAGEPVDAGAAAPAETLAA